jgi:hypothetical protein
MLNIPLLYLGRVLVLLPAVAFILIFEKLVMERWLAFNFNAPFFYPARLRESNSGYWTPLLFTMNFQEDVYGTVRSHE